MQSVFTINYGEFVLADYLKKKIKKASVFIPASRTEKGVDLALYKHDFGKNHMLTIQVKQSRSYIDKKSIPIDGSKTGTCYGFWFNNFKVPPNADWIILVGIYPHIPKIGSKKTNTKSFKWEQVYLAFTNSEMKEFLRKNKLKTNPKKNDSHFDFHIDIDGKNAIKIRGSSNKDSLNNHLIKNRISEIKEDLDKHIIGN